MIQSQVYPNHSDVDWEEYIDWTSAGHGDEWFQAEEDEEEFQAEEDEEEFQAESEEDEEEGDWQEVFDDDIIRAEKNREAQREEQLFLPGYYEAQTRQRTAYLCQDMVRPCSTSLDDRIVTLAHLVSRDTKEAPRPGLDAWSRMVRCIINGQRQTPTDI